MIRAPLLVLTLIAASSAAAYPQAAPPPAGVKTWVGHAAAMEDHLRRAEVVSLEDVSVGVTRPRRAHLSPRDPFESLAWKVLPPGMRGGYRESYKSEIAAYELDKLIGLNMVPPAVERRIDGDVGAAIMWIDGVTSVRERGGRMPSGPAFNKPIRMMQMFDNLIGNIDRNGGNILIDRTSQVILIDHSRAFVGKQDLPWKFERVDAGLWTTLAALTADGVKAKLAPWLDDEAVAAMIGRRDRMKAAIDKLVARKGAAAVLIP